MAEKHEAEMAPDPDEDDLSDLDGALCVYRCESL